MDDKKWIGDWIDENAGIFTEVNDSIWDYAELAFHEYRSAELLEDMLGKAGFKVKKGIAGIPTAFTAEASVGSGKPVMGILGEYDALSQKRSPGRAAPIRDTAADIAAWAPAPLPRPWR